MLNKLSHFEEFNYKKNNEPNDKIKFSPVDKIPVEVSLKLYRHMMRLRRMQESLIREYHPADEIRCPVHFCIGQEAAPAVLNALLNKEDYLFCHHRSHGYYLSKVNSMNGLICEMYGKENGANGGKAGSQDVSSHTDNFYSGAILAGTVPIAAGAAFAAKVKGQSFCAVAATGEAATDEGVYWETLNYAALKKLPMLFIVENNFYSTYSPQPNRSLTCNIAERAQAFGVRSQTVFGNDVVLLYNETKKALDYIRSGEGPVLIEAFTYRWNSHVGPESDDYVNYRSKEELEHWKSLCPINAIEKGLLASGALNEKARLNLQTEIEHEIAAAFDLAKRSSFPKPQEWVNYNLSRKSPLADEFLEDQTNLNFNENQAEAVPGPY